MCMGPPKITQLTRPHAWVYPHVYGATPHPAGLQSLPAGLSPCVWGHRNRLNRIALYRGSIPMCMGPPLIISIIKIALRVYPHVYGAIGVLPVKPAKIAGLSPCVWGHHEAFAFTQGSGGSIPMCMGPPSRLLRFIIRIGVYPHVYGATSNHVHNINGKQLDATTVARYKTTSYEEGRKRAFELFDSKFSFDYSESNWDESNMKFFPNGYIDLD